MLQTCFDQFSLKTNSANHIVWFWNSALSLRSSVQNIYIYKNKFKKKQESILLRSVDLQSKCSLFFFFTVMPVSGGGGWGMDRTNQQTRSFPWTLVLLNMYIMSIGVWKTVWGLLPVYVHFKEFRLNCFCSSTSHGICASGDVHFFVGIVVLSCYL